MKRNPGVLRLYSQRMKLSKNNGEFLGTCPFHDDSTPSFTVSQNDGKYLYKCFGCGASGSVLDFVMKFDKVGFGEAVRKMEQELNTSWGKQKEMVESSFQPAIKNEKKKLVIPLSKYYTTGASP